MSLSYVIGFTAAFIGFGVTSTNFEPVGEPAAVARTSLTVLPVSETSPVQVETAKASGVRYDTNLYAIVGDEDVLIAADDSYGTGIGFYHSVVSFELVDDGQSVAFCVLETQESENCTPFTYDVANNIVSEATEVESTL